MNEFHRLEEQLELSRCPTCRGLGKCDDADFGDIYYNEWTCPTCKGTGINPESTAK